MLASIWSCCTTGAYSSSEPAILRTARLCAGAMPSSISSSMRDRCSTGRRPRSTSAQATSNRLWLATPTRTAPFHSGRSADSSINL